MKTLNRVQQSLSKWYSKASGILNDNHGASSDEKQRQTMNNDEVKPSDKDNSVDEDKSLFAKFSTQLGDQINQFFQTDEKKTGSSKVASSSGNKANNEQERQSEHLSIAKESLDYLLQDKRVPSEVRNSLQSDYEQIEQMLQKLENESIHIAVLGRVSVGKSSLLNALLGQTNFSVSPLHGETKQAGFENWQEYRQGNVVLIDTPGINEIDGQEREQMALEVVSRSDIILFVVDSDITETELAALKKIATGVQPIVMVLNKSDRFNKNEKALLLQSLQQHSQGLVEAEHIICAVSTKSLKHYIKIDENGNESEFSQEILPQVEEVKSCLWSLLEKEGKTIAALNAALFAGDLSTHISQRLVETQKTAAEKLIRTYCIAKGVAVAVNPVPVADLMAAAIIDVGLIRHLSKIYGLPLNKSEAGQLITTIMAQIALLMGSIWAMNLMSSVLKLSSGGLSTVLTASAQGAVAYYGTYVVGQAAQLYFKQGKSWGELGPKRAVQKILESLDRDSIIEQAKDDIMTRIKTKQPS